MTSVSEATSIILGHLFPADAEQVPLARSAGRILAGSVQADRDLPPFDRVTMDGIALRFDEFEKGRRTFRVAGIQPAGVPAQELGSSSDCIEIMTGALLPQGADTIVRMEDIELLNGSAIVRADTVTRGQFIHRRGSDALSHAVLLTPGIKISPAEIALLASLGNSNVPVFRFPRVAVVSTGNELVPVSQTPLPYQLRQSNAGMLEAALEDLHCASHSFHVTDDRGIMTEKIGAIMDTHDVIILTGGVSKGKFDFVPAVAESLGIRKLFHQVSQRPGKPFWFGRSEKNTVFALPGNPVSALLCFVRYIRPWFLKSMLVQYEFTQVILATDYQFQYPLTLFLQVKLRYDNGRMLAWPETGGGSGDFANLRDADGFLELPAERSEFRAGEIFSFIPFR